MKKIVNNTIFSFLVNVKMRQHAFQWVFVSNETLAQFVIHRHKMRCFTVSCKHAQQQTIGTRLSLACRHSLTPTKMSEHTHTHKHTNTKCALSKQTLLLAIAALQLCKSFIISVISHLKATYIMPQKKGCAYWCLTSQSVSIPFR